MAILGLTFFYPISVVLLLITTRTFVEARYLPSNTMLPTFNVEDRVLIEKVKTHLKRPYVRGEIIVFYPPPIEMGGRDLSRGLPEVLGRLTGLPFFPYETAFIKRVIGLPGDNLRITAGQGVFVNEKLLNESSYIQDRPKYTLNVMGDIQGRDVNGAIIRPYNDPTFADKPIVVPPGQLFVLGDNRNNSIDSHVFGMVRDDRVIGRAILKFWPGIKLIEPPIYDLDHKP